MYIFICDSSPNPSFLHKELYNFYSEVLSDIDSDAMTNAEIAKELKSREIAKIIEKGSMMLIFKKF